MSPRSFKLPSTTDWHKLTLVLNSGEHNSLNVYAGRLGGTEGKLWWNDWEPRRGRATETSCAALEPGHGPATRTGRSPITGRPGFCRRWRSGVNFYNV